MLSGVKLQNLCTTLNNLIFLINTIRPITDNHNTYIYSNILCQFLSGYEILYTLYSSREASKGAYGKSVHSQKANYIKVKITIQESFNQKFIYT